NDELGRILLDEIGAIQGEIDTETAPILRIYNQPCHGVITHSPGQQPDRGRGTSQRTGLPCWCGLRLGGLPDESSRRTRTDDGVTTEVVMVQALEVLGSLFVLAAFAGAQRGAVSTGSRVYLALNLIGSAVLA